MANTKIKENRARVMNAMQGCNKQSVELLDHLIGNASSRKPMFRRVPHSRQRLFWKRSLLPWAIKFKAKSESVLRCTVTEPFIATLGSAPQYYRVHFYYVLLCYRKKQSNSTKQTNLHWYACNAGHRKIVVMSQQIQKPVGNGDAMSRRLNVVGLGNQLWITRKRCGWAFCDETVRAEGLDVN